MVVRKSVLEATTQFTFGKAKTTIKKTTIEQMRRQGGGDMGAKPSLDQ